MYSSISRKALALFVIAMVTVDVAQAFDFGNMMNPSRWWGGDRDRDDDYYDAPPYGYGYPAPGYGVPGYAAPGYTAPAYTTPAYTAPAYPAPGYAAPGYMTPGYGAPAYTAPAVSAPVRPGGHGPRAGRQACPGRQAGARDHFRRGGDRPPAAAHPRAGGRR